MPTSTSRSASGGAAGPHDAVQLTVARRARAQSPVWLQSFTAFPSTSVAVTLGAMWSAWAAGAVRAATASRAATRAGYRRTRPSYPNFAALANRVMSDRQPSLDDALAAST